MGGLQPLTIAKSSPTSPSVRVGGWRHRKQDAQLGGSMMSGGLETSGVTGVMAESMEVEMDEA